MDSSKETSKEKEPVESGLTIQILKDVAEKYRSLIEEADELFSKGDSEGYKRKLVERAELIKNLPGQLDQAVDRKTLKNREEISRVTNLLAFSAEKALEPGRETYRALKPRHKYYYGLNVLTGTESGKTGDSNPLDILIKSIKEQKYSKNNILL